jgi:hypothetical protein
MSNGTKNEKVDKRSMFTKSREPCLKLLIRSLNKDRIGAVIGVGTSTSCHFATNELVADGLKSGTRENCFDDCLKLQNVVEDGTAPREEA